MMHVESSRSTKSFSIYSLLCNHEQSEPFSLICGHFTSPPKALRILVMFAQCDLVIHSSYRCVVRAGDPAVQTVQLSPPSLSHALELAVELPRPVEHHRSVDVFVAVASFVADIH
jgi:hypothetical protein